MQYAVIMAGGSGKRLWPLSRESRPKQILKLLDGQTLLRKCYERLLGVFDPRNILILCNAGYSDLVCENLPELPRDNVIAEPAVRDTSGAIGLAASVLTKYDADATMAVLTADHIIEPVEDFQRVIADGLSFVENNPQAFVTFGIQPTYPSTQLGYIKLAPAIEAPSCTSEVFKVDSFREKPDQSTAEQYLATGDYVWNSGMFIWKARTVLSKITESLPDAVEPLRRIQAHWDGPDQRSILESEFIKLPKISIDYAVMERADCVYTIKLNCRWLDMGSFAALADIISSDSGNNVVVAGHNELLDCNDSIFVTEDDGHLIAGIGLDNMIVAHSPDATLVCPLDQAHKLKDLLERIKHSGGGKFL